MDNTGEVNQTTRAERPLVTFALFAYNQEKYIREAVEGAFTQTYEPLEIILSDDCSSDRTFEIMQEMAAAYKGPHRLIVNRSKMNRGFGAHINRVVSLCKTDWIVVSAGDDISLPERTTKLLSIVRTSAKETTLVHSAAIKISENGEQLKIDQSPWLSSLTDLSKSIRDRAYVLGATAAWHKTLFSEFAPLPDSLMNEDVVLQVRALLSGSIAYSELPLVKHRIGGVSGEVKAMTLEQRIFGLPNDGWVVARQQQLDDMRRFNAPPAALSEVEAQLSLFQFRQSIGIAASPIGKVKQTIVHIRKTGRVVDAVRHLALALFPRISEMFFNNTKKLSVQK